MPDTNLLLSALETVILRELGAVKRELEAYPDEASVWRAVPGISNSGGTLALHLAGNLQHFFGGILGRDGYKREWDAEFARRDVPRKELIAGIDATIQSVQRTISGLTEDSLARAYPEPIAKRTIGTATWLVHLATHAAYHLGQINYHRRAVTGDSRTVDSLSVRELPEMA